VQEESATRRPRTRRLVLFVAIVAALAVPSAALAAHFADVGANDVHSPGIHYLSDTGITLGCATNPDRFCPNDGLTRAQMGSFLFRASGHDPDTPPSVNAASIAEVVLVGGDPDGQNSINGSAVNTASVSCPEGTMVTGGGSQTTTPGGWIQAYSRPLADGTGWTAQYVEKDGNLGVNTTTVWALCVAVGP
jgi:hypothetical protein